MGRKVDMDDAPYACDVRDGRMPKLRTLAPLVRRTVTKAIEVERKTADPFYLTPQYRRWREQVIGRAGWRCEVIEDGQRCVKSEANGDRLFADHIVELQDGGPPYDVANGRCLCGRHHTLKTVSTRARRLGGGGV